MLCNTEIGCLSLSKLFFELANFSLETRMTFYNPAFLTLIIRKYVVSLLKIMANISKMDKRNSSTKLGALVSAIKLSFSSKGKGKKTTW